MTQKPPEYECVLCPPKFERKPKFHTYEAFQRHARRVHFPNTMKAILNAN